MVKFKDFSRPLSVLSTFQGKLLSRTVQDSPVYSSTFQVCVNPVVIQDSVGIHISIPNTLLQCSG